MYGYNKTYTTKYAYWHPVYKSTNIILNPTGYSGYINVFQSNNGIYGSPSRGTGISTIPMIHGKYYWEITVLQAGSSSNERFGVISPYNFTSSQITSRYQNSILGYTDSSTHPHSSIGIRSNTWNGTLYYEDNYLSSVGQSGYISGSGTYSISNGDVFGFLLDATYGSFSVRKNNTQLFYLNNNISSGQLTLTSSSGVWFAACASDGGTTTASTYWANFGQATFSYTPPEGFNNGITNLIYPRLDPNHTNYYNAYVFLLNNNLTARVDKGMHSGVVYILAQFGKSVGKWYWEVEITGGSVSNAPCIGVAYQTVTAFPSYLNPDVWCWANNTKIRGGEYDTYGGFYGVGDNIGVALDMDSGSITLYKNGISLGIMFTGLTAGATGSLYPYASNYMSTSGIYDGPTYRFNFGQSKFKYSVPIGYNYGLYI